MNPTENAATGLPFAVILGVAGLVVAGGLVLKRWSDRSRHAAVSAERARAEAQSETARRDIDTLLFKVAHDLKEPLRGLGHNARYLNEEDLSDTARDRVARMGVLVERAEARVSDLVTYASVGTEPAEDLDLAAIVGEVRNTLGDWLETQRADVVIVSDLPRLHASATDMETLFKWLILNGLAGKRAACKQVDIGFDTNSEPSLNPGLNPDTKPRNAPGAVFKTVLRPRQSADAAQGVFWVRANSPGLNGDAGKRVFGSFQMQGHGQEHGTFGGSGLAFARRIVGHYGGQLTLDPIDDASPGVCFTLPKALRPEQR